MILTLEQNEINFIMNLVMQRPMGEVEGLVYKLRQQVAEQLNPPAPPAPEDTAAGGTD